MRIGTCRVLIALTLSVGTAAAVSYSVEAQAVEFLVFGSSDFNAGNTLSLSGAVTLSNTDSGWWRSDGEHRDFNNNYAVGRCCEGGDEFRTHNFFVFDISDLTDPITDASLTLFTYQVVRGPHTYMLFDVLTDIDELQADGSGAAGVAIYSDLGSGTAYGSHRYFNRQSNTFQTIALNEDFLADLNAAIAGDAQLFALGGALQVIDEPATLTLFGAALLGLGLLGFGLTRRRTAN
jgi:hypothetical protein